MLSSLLFSWLEKWLKSYWFQTNHLGKSEQCCFRWLLPKPGLQLRPSRVHKMFRWTRRQSRSPCFECRPLNIQTGCWWIKSKLEWKTSARVQKDPSVVLSNATVCIPPCAPQGSLVNWNEKKSSEVLLNKALRTLFNHLLHKLRSIKLVKLKWTNGVLKAKFCLSPLLNKDNKENADFSTWLTLRSSSGWRQGSRTISKQMF